MGHMMRKLELTIATSDYDHLRDFRIGEVRAEGIDPIWLSMDFHEIFARFAARRDWDVSEMSFAKFTALASQPEAEIIGLPVFPSRMFRFSSFYINRHKGIHSAADLRGKRVGVPEWAQTAAVYTRGWLQHVAGVPLTDIEWVQAGTDEAGRLEKVDLTLPKGLSLTRVSDRTLGDMVASGELDCVMIAREPKVFRQKHPDVVRLFPDYRKLEEDYYDATGVFPIMHVIAMRKSLLDQHPWAARNLYLAFEEAKHRSLERIRDNAVSRYPIPWLGDYIRGLQARFGEDLHPYGLEANLPTLKLFTQYAYEQGISGRLVAPEDLFASGLDISVKV
jgi:4,5-dihydroxyphthalate decarboxylase